jgi:hypothetical protein
MPETVPGIGHNRPPGSEDARLLDRSELEQIKRDAAEASKWSPTTAPPEAQATASRWRTLGKLVLGYIVLKQGDMLITEGVKAAGKHLWESLGDRLIASSEAILAWLQSLL